jgi:hypothetical protein
MFTKKCVHVDFEKRNIFYFLTEFRLPFQTFGCAVLLKYDPNDIKYGTQFLNYCQRCRESFRRPDGINTL